MINESINSASITNEDFGNKDLTWDEATFTWNEGAGTWDNPYSMTNETINSATLTNETYA